MLKRFSPEPLAQQGFTLVEISVVVGLVLSLLALSSLNLTGLIPKASTRSTFKSLAADIKSQQLKAMSGSTAGGSEPAPQGVHFDNNSYVLFSGGVYSQGDSNNIVVELENGAIFSNVDLPDDSIIFVEGSGEVSGFDSDHNSVSVSTGAGSDPITIEVNQYGVLSWN